MRNQRGLITVDFVFAIVLILGFSALSFVLSFTLSVASVVQYITFATARNYTVAHITNGDQEERAAAKYKELINHPVFKPLFTNGWYQVDAEPTIGDHTRVIPGFEAAAQDSNKFWGTGTSFIAKVLDFRIPFFGATNPDGDGTGSAFKTYMGSYLGREPSTKECLDLVAVRWTAIRALPGANYSAGSSANGYFPQADDGC